MAWFSSGFDYHGLGPHCFIWIQTRIWGNNCCYGMGLAIYDIERAMVIDP
jgi:hypothetical protein